VALYYSEPLKRSIDRLIDCLIDSFLLSFTDSLVSLLEVYWRDALHKCTFYLLTWTQEQRDDRQALQQLYDDQRLQTTDLRRQLDEMKLIVDDNTTEMELRKANDSLSQLRGQLDTSERQVTSFVAEK